MKHDYPCFVLDTNTVFSGLIWPDSVPALALAKALRYRVVVSEEVAQEMRNVMSRPQFDRLKPLSERMSDLDNFLKKCELVTVKVVVQACRDPKDDKFLALAKSANAVLIVSGDRDLLDMNPWEGIPILTPRQFVEQEIE